MSLLPIFRWLEGTSVGAAIRTSTYLFPAIEVIHLLGLVLVLGPVLAVDLSLLGLATRREAISDMAKAAEPLIWIGTLIMVCTGTLLLASEAVKCYGSGAFWFKMYSLAGALIFQFAVYRRLSSHPPGRAISKMVAILSLALWFGVAVGGRVIAFL